MRKLITVAAAVAAAAAMTVPAVANAKHRQQLDFLRVR